MKGPKRDDVQNFWDQIESQKVHGRKECKFGAHCRYDVCHFKHKKEDYYALPLIAEFLDLFKTNSYEKLCEYNIGDEKIVEALIKAVRNRINCFSTKLIAGNKYNMIFYFFFKGLFFQNSEREKFFHKKLSEDSLTLRNCKKIFKLLLEKKFSLLELTKKIRSNI